MARTRPEQISGPLRRGFETCGRGAQGSLHLALIVGLAGPPAELRAASTADADTTAATQDVQTLYESCLRQLDEGAAAAAANCLEDVYGGLVAIDRIARTDLYYVLADAVTASTAAAASDPQALCLAHRLIVDWTERERSVPKLRLRGKVKKMAAEVKKAMDAAGVQPEQCVMRRLEVATSGETTGPSEVTEPTPGETPVDGTEAKPEEGAEPKPAEVKPAPVKPVVKPVPKKTTPRTMRKLGLTAKTDLMDAGFATTIASIGVAGLGGAMWAAKIECDAREGRGEGSCPSPVPDGVRDAGLALMSIGAAGVFVGLSLRWADQRRQRRLRQAPMPSMGPTSLGISWRGEF